MIEAKALDFRIGKQRTIFWHYRPERERQIDVA